MSEPSKALEPNTIELITKKITLRATGTVGIVALLVVLTVAAVIAAVIALTNFF